MDDIFFHHVCNFLDPNIFHETNMSVLCKHAYLKKRQNKINQEHSARALNRRFWKNEMRNIMIIFLDDYTHFMKYISGILLRDLHMDLFVDTLQYKRSKILVKKYVMSNTILEFDNNHKIRYYDFESCQDIIEDVEICSTYRMGIAKKQVLIDHYPYAKALIY